MSYKRTKLFGYTGYFLIAAEAAVKTGGDATS